MKHLVLYCLLGSLSLGCADHRIEEDNLNAVKDERVITTRLADISQWGIQKVNGFAKQGSRVVVETGVEYGGIKTIDLNHPGAMDPMGRGESSLFFIVFRHMNRFYSHIIIPFPAVFTLYFLRILIY